MTRLTTGPINEVQEASDGSLVLRAPLRLTRRSGRKLVQLPPGATDTGRPWDARPTPLQQALARASRWLHALEAGQFATLGELAKRERCDFSYVSRLLNLTTLAPDIIEAILDDRLPDHVTLHTLAINPPLLWEAQRQRLWPRDRPSTSSPETAQKGKSRKRTTKSS